MEVDTRALEKLVIGLWDGSVTIKEVVDAAVKKGRSDLLPNSVKGYTSLCRANQLCKELELTELPFDDEKTIVWNKIKNHEYFADLKFVLEDCYYTNTDKLQENMQKQIAKSDYELLKDQIGDQIVQHGTDTFMKALFEVFRGCESASQLYEWCNAAEPLYDKMVGKDS